MLRQYTVLFGGLALLAVLCHAGSSHPLASPEGGAAVPEKGRILRTPGKVEVLSKLYNVDRIFKSMTGPWSRNDIEMLTGGTPELVWITGARVEMVDADAQRSMPEQFMCHANLDIDVEKHRELFGFTGYRDTRMFTLSQGQLEVKFPEGFGIPVMSNEPLQLITQALNLNFKDQQFKVRHRVTLDFRRQCELTEPLKPLYQAGVFGMKTLEEHELAFDAPDALFGEEKCSSCCLPGKKAVDWAEGIDRFGRKFTGHWVVKPGREENRTRATTMFSLTGETKIHYIAVHLHPYAESLELRDVTTGESIFKSHARNLVGQVGLDHVDSFSSPEGVTVYPDHEYEVISVYNNTSDEDQDSMAVMYVYLLDNEFQRPAQAAVAQQ